ncbi:MAG: helix-turn-helix domain-containing protein [Bacillota bacterium]|jgi:transcriptional regulator with XRE-family HTH domain
MRVSLGKKIRHLRQLKNWAQAELAERAGVSRSYISELERETREPTIGIMKNIADAFKVPIDIFFDETTLFPLAELNNVLPDDIQEFLREQDGLAYVQLARKAKDLKIPKEALDSIIEALRQVRGRSREE